MTSVRPTILQAVYSEILRDVDEPSRRFVGDWDLLSWYSESKETGERRYPFGWDAIGRLFYSPEGRVSVHLSRRSRTEFEGKNPFSASESELAVAFMESLAYTGRYAVSPEDQEVTHHVLTSTDPGQTGNELIRDYAFDEDSQILHLSLDYEGGFMVQTWKRMTPEKPPRRREI